MKVRLIRNEQIRRALVGRPSGERRLRVIIELEGEVLIFEEAAFANLARAYHWVYDHPQRFALELRYARLAEEQRKKGYAEHQLLETEKPDAEVQREIDALIARAAEG
ncbi:MAG: hypothetical protein C4339_06665 [Nitrososphaerota archaeon]